MIINCMLRSVHHIVEALTSENIYHALVNFPTDDFPIPQHILSSNTFTPYFDGCIGALDGTHLPVHVPKAGCAAFHNRKGVLLQNILAVCTMDMQFLYIIRKNQLFLLHLITSYYILFLLF